MNIMTDSWTTPPECQGQIVVRSYRYHYETDRVWEMKHDRSDGTTMYRSASCTEEETCEFWNHAPTLSDWRDEKILPQDWR